MTRDSSVPVCPLCAATESIAVPQILPEAPVEPDEATAATPTPGPGASVCAVTWCRAEIPAGARACPACGDVVPESRLRAPAPARRRAGAQVRSARLELPGALVVELLPGQSLVLGRESPDARVADALDPFPDISRRHARIEVTTTDVRVLDVGSTFGTTVDGGALEGIALVGAGRHSIDLAGHAVATLTVSTDAAG